MDIKSYADAGVDIEKGDRFAEFIGSLKSKAVSGEIGGFAGGIEIDIEKYKKPVLLSATDGVGTKLLLARQLEKYDTIGIDLVAMCVNDLIVCGADPVNCLDYIACGKLNEKVMQEIIKGVVDGCEQSECILAGGETAEMPDVYAEQDFDLAGFCVGLVNKEDILPKKDKISKGDAVLALPSTGIHSNGLSLARKVIKKEDIEGRKELLKPTKIYVKDLKELLKTGKILSAAHITGGGLVGNLKRSIPDNLNPDIDFSSWKVPEIFQKIQKEGKIETEEMRKVFNMGIGIAFVVKEADADAVMAHGKKAGIEVLRIGKLL
jgi:phosphoribosylformylglycinamidine cyclo-ligase